MYISNLFLIKVNTGVPELKASTAGYNSRGNSEPEMSYTWFRIAAVAELAAVEA
jgi:hypothetical protein